MSILCPIPDTAELPKELAQPRTKFACSIVFNALVCSQLFKVSVLFHTMTAAADVVQVQGLCTCCVNSHGFCTCQISSLLLSILVANCLMCPARWLQEAGLLISRKAHGAHHKAPFEGNYCIVSGLWNNVLDQNGSDQGFFRKLERLVAARTGVEPRCWYEPKYEVEEMPEASAQSRIQSD